MSFTGITAGKVKREKTRRQVLWNETSHDDMLPVTSTYQLYDSTSLPQQCAQHARMKLAVNHGNVQAQNQRSDHSSRDSMFLASVYEQPVTVSELWVITLYYDTLLLHRKRTTICLSCMH